MSNTHQRLALTLLAESTVVLARDLAATARQEREAAALRLRQAQEQAVLQEQRDREQADRARARTRTELDRVAGAWAGVAAITALVPFLIGHFLMRRTFILPADPGVYAPEIRGILDHFKADYLAGLVSIALALAAFLLLRPWRFRIGSVAAGWALVVAACILLGSAGSAWRSAEAVSTAKLRETAYPFASHYYSCRKWTLAAKNESGQNELWQVYLAQVSGTTGADCNRVEVYRGWLFVGRFTLDNGRVFTGDVSVMNSTWNKPVTRSGSTDFYSTDNTTHARVPLDPVVTQINLPVTQGNAVSFSLVGAGRNEFRS